MSRKVIYKTLVNGEEGNMYMLWMKDIFSRSFSKALVKADDYAPKREEIVDEVAIRKSGCEGKRFYGIAKAVLNSKIVKFYKIDSYTMTDRLIYAVKKEFPKDAERIEIKIQESENGVWAEFYQFFMNSSVARYECDFVLNQRNFIPRYVGGLKDSLRIGNLIYKLCCDVLELGEVSGINIYIVGGELAEMVLILDEEE